MIKPEWISNGQHLLPHKQVGAVTQGDRFELVQHLWGRLQLQHCHIPRGVAPNHLGWVHRLVCTQGQAVTRMVCISGRYKLAYIGQFWVRVRHARVMHCAKPHHKGKCVSYNACPLCISPEA